MKKVIGFIAVLIVFLSSCGGNSTPATPQLSVAISPSTQKSIDQGQTLNFTATVTNDSSSGGVTWTLSGTGCTGSACGTLTNTSTTAATYNAPASGSSPLTVTVTATSVAKSTVSASATVVVSAAPAVTTTSLPGGTVGTAYSQTLAASGGTAPLAWSITTGTLPAGLALNASTGVISGTPTASGPSSFTVKVTDSAATPMTATKALGITINNPPLTITTTSVANGLVGTAYSASVVAVGGTTSYTWSISAGSLPAGLIQNTSTGAIAGNPTTPGTSTFTVMVTDSTTPTAETATQQLTITVYSVMSITTTSLPSGTVNTSYSNAVAVTGGTSPYTWSLASGTLLAGLSLNASTGVISGTPTATGTASFTVRVTDSSSPQQVQTQPLTITVNGASGGTLTITSTTLPAGALNVPYLGTVGVSGGTSPYTWSVTVGTLPAGLSLDTSTGVISGTPTAAATSNFTVTVTDSTTPTAQTKSQALSIDITTVAACTSSGNESALSGQYAFSLSGFNSSGFLATIGSFTADGTGKFTAGEADTNGALGSHAASINTTTSSYSVGSDNRGCATIVTSFGTFNTRFVLGSLSSGKATQGRMMEWEAPNSSAYIAAGQILQQTSSSFSGGPSGKYVYSNVGVDSQSTPGRAASEGVLTASGGAFSNGEVDINDAGTVTNVTGVTGTYTSADTNGRLTGTTTPPSSSTTHQVYYMVSSSRMLLLSTDAASTNGVLAGELRGQSGTFSNSSLSGKLVFYMAGLSSGGSGDRAQLGLASADGSGSLTVSIYEDDAGTWVTPTPSAVACAYSVAANGRTTLSGSNCGNHSPVFYLSGVNTGFMLDTGGGVDFGQAEPQTGGSFSVSSLSGAFFNGTTEVVGQGAETSVAAVTLTSGSLSGTGDFTSTSSQGADQAESGTLTVNSDGTIISSDHPGLVTGIIVSNSKAVILDNQGSTYPTISVVSK